MGNSFYLNFFKKGKNGFYVNSGGSKKGFANGFSTEFFFRNGNVRVFNVENFSYKGETVVFEKLPEWAK